MLDALCRLCPQKQRLGSKTRKFAVGWTGADRTDLRKIVCGLYRVRWFQLTCSFHEMASGLQAHCEVWLCDGRHERHRSTLQGIHSGTQSALILYQLCHYNLRQSGVG